MKFIKLKEVQRITSLSRSLIYKKIQENRFPKQIKTSDNSTAWLEEEIYQWMKARIKLRKMAGEK